MQNARLDESETGIKTAQRNINNLRYAHDSTLMAESKEELKNLLMNVKEESEKAGLKFNIQKMNITASSPITSWQIDWETMETVTDFIFSSLSAIKVVSSAYLKLFVFLLAILIPACDSFSSIQSLSRVQLFVTP